MIWNLIIILEELSYHKKAQIAKLSIYKQIKIVNLEISRKPKRASSALRTSCPWHAPSVTRRDTSGIWQQDDLIKFLYASHVRLRDPSFRKWWNTWTCIKRKEGEDPENKSKSRSIKNKPSNYPRLDNCLLKTSKPNKNDPRSDYPWLSLAAIHYIFQTWKFRSQIQPL